MASRSRGRAQDDENECSRRSSEEVARCYARRGERSGAFEPRFLQACLDRAKARQDLCERNGGRLPKWEPPEWGSADEEEWYNENR